MMQHVSLTVVRDKEPTQWASRTTGFTLIEILLVMAILSVLTVMGVKYAQQQATNMRVERAAHQMQYILNAGLAYYVAKGSWPGTCGKQYDTNYTSSGGSGGGGGGSPPPAPSGLQPEFLPAAPVYNPLAGDSGSPYYFYSSTCSSASAGGGSGSGGASSSSVIPPNTFSVMAMVGTSDSAQAIGTVVAGRLPFGFYDKTTGMVATYVNIPGQNLNNASAINFAGLFHHGDCVPVPSCPQTNGTLPTMTPQVFVVPVSLSGLNNTSSSGNLYPMTSFTAYATTMSVVGGSPPLCNGVAGTGGLTCVGVAGVTSATNQYWRACVRVITQGGDDTTLNGDITQTAGNWPKYMILAVFTRCAISQEPQGSSNASFKVYI